MKEQSTEPKPKVFTRYQVFVIAILAILQFTIVLDFMVLSPLGPYLLDELHITTKQFGWVVSAYAFSAGAAGLLTAGFADKFDRKKLLLFFYVGFTLGTALCAMADTYEFMLMARIITGLFGGVIGSISFAIITDLFKMEVRGRVMGFVQMAFASSQVLGLPIGLYLAGLMGWHAPFWMIAAMCVLIGVAIVVYFKPVTSHLQLRSDKGAFLHLAHTISNPNYLKAFAATTLLATGGFMLMPFGSTFGVYNLGIDVKEDLPMLYMITGICSMIAGPLVGKYSDAIGKYRIFVMGSLLSMVMVAIYCNLGVTPLHIIILLNVFLFVGISSRMISASALMTAIPEAKDRGSFMSINSSVQQISGGFASILAGLIVVQTTSGHLERYDLLGYTVDAAILITIIMMYFIDKQVKAKTQKAATQEPAVA
ncbi:MFS transporter [Chryseolinea sp. T2]|uniref:MFS transporter n=1 Tax=Chryseolinea sp. T2 TaxID=3129255 RepID=UPI003077B142